jgi:integrase
MSNIVDVMLATGARLGEVLALRWADMALDADCPSLTINGTTRPSRATALIAGPPKSDSSVMTVVLADSGRACGLRHGSAQPCGGTPREFERRGVPEP